MTLQADAGPLDIALSSRRFGSREPPFGNPTPLVLWGEVRGSLGSLLWLEDSQPIEEGVRGLALSPPFGGSELHSYR